MTTKVQFFNDLGTQYNTKTKKEERKIEAGSLMYGNASPMTEANQMRSFGKTGVAETVVRFTVPIPDEYTLAMVGDKKFIVATMRNYGRDSVAYLREVKSW